MFGLPFFGLRIIFRLRLTTLETQKCIYNKLFHKPLEKVIQLSWFIGNYRIELFLKTKIKLTNTVNVALKVILGFFFVSILDQDVVTRTRTKRSKSKQSEHNLKNWIKIKVHTSRIH